MLRYHIHFDSSANATLKYDYLHLLPLVCVARRIECRAPNRIYASYSLPCALHGTLQHSSVALRILVRRRFSLTRSHPYCMRHIHARICVVALPSFLLALARAAPLYMHIMLLPLSVCVCRSISACDTSQPVNQPTSQHSHSCFSFVSALVLFASFLLSLLDILGYLVAQEGSTLCFHTIENYFVCIFSVVSHDSVCFCDNVVYFAVNASRVP